MLKPLRSRPVSLAGALLGAVLLAPAGGASPASAQAASADSDGAAGDATALTAARRTGEVEIDGRLTEDAWADAPVASEFVQGEPREGASPAQPTEVRVLYDDEALYVGARLHEPSRSAIADQLVRRDEEGQYDYFEVLLDPNLDRQTGYRFRVSAAGVQRDAFVSRDSREDVNWDAVWRSAVGIGDEGWTVEFRIPLSQIRYESRETPQEWGVNFVRRRLASNSISYFSLQSRTVEGVVSQAGLLRGVLLTDAESRFQVEPYVAGELFTSPAAPGDPFFGGSEFSPRAGVGVQYGVGSNFTLDATVNPDFGQVEVDPAVVNLSAFETFFPEKRPFFVQDAQVFDFDLGGRRSQLFFSRRIGREPQGRAPEGAAFTQAPDRTTILGASKFTGRTADGLSVGVLAALTQEEKGRALFPERDRTASFVAEPASRYAVGRVQQDFRGGATRVGAILTTVDRSLPENGRLDRLPSSALSGGVDFEHQWGGPGDRRWSLSGYVAGTRVEGSREAMLEIQTNPQHYYQRPDADDLSVDSTTTHLTGVNWNLQFAKQSGEHWTWDVSVEELSPDFAVNDLGFNTQGEQIDFTGRVSYQDIEPGPLFRNWRVDMFSFHELRHELLDDPWSAGQWERAYKDGGAFTNAEFEFLNNWELDLGFNFGLTSLSDTETRGGPLMTDPGEISGEVRLQTDRREPVSVGPSVEFTDRFQGAGGNTELGLGVTVRPTPAFEFSMEPQVSFQDDASQFVASTDAVPYGPTFGTRYLFADLERTELSVETRLNAAFSPDLSLQLFVQPLISSGDFVAFKQLARPESFSFLRFPEGDAVVRDGEVVCRDGATCVADGSRFVEFDEESGADFSFPVQDFNFRSLRGNAVLRWEYSPGSTLFLVWQQNRQDQQAVGDFDLSRDLDALFGSGTENTFILKVSHFLDL
jgi:hypothetical protein